MASILGKLENFLKYSSNLHKVLSGNVAQANTPGFKAKIIERPSSKLNNRRKLKAIKTNGKHLVSSNYSDYKILNDKSQTNFKANGNNVDIVEQSLLMSSNNSEYGLALKAYKNSLKLFTTAIGNK